MDKGLGFRVKGYGFRVQGLGFRDMFLRARFEEGLGFRVAGIQNPYCLRGCPLCVWGLGFGI